MEQHLKEAKRRLNSSQEKAASIEERDALVRKGSTCQELRRQKERLREARRWEDNEERKEAAKQQKTRKAEREACIRRAAEEASAKDVRLQKARDKVRGNLI
jgi:hypothetical protein